MAAKARKLGAAEEHSDEHMRRTATKQYKVRTLTACAHQSWSPGSPRQTVIMFAAANSSTLSY
jgi:hypothetical protein